MKKLLLLTTVAVTILSVFQLSALEAKPVAKNKKNSFFAAKKELNNILEKHWKKANLSKVAISDDYTFIRRATLDLTGKIPTVQEIRKFVANKNPYKRAILIKTLLASPSYADLTAQRYAHIFRIKSEFPINLWPNAVQLYFRYFHDAATKDMRYDLMAYQLLTTNGSNFRNPESNFFRATPGRTPKDLAKIAALTFLNINTLKLTDGQQEAFANFFSRIRYKSTDEWKEEIVYNAPEEVTLKCVEPINGESFTINTGKEDPRVVFANYITKGNGKKQFAKAFANRVWHQLFGFGIENPVDDMHFTGEISYFQKFFNLFKSEEEPTFENELLEFLAAYTIKTNFSRKELIQLITSCKAYHASWKTNPNEMATAKKFFAIYPLRRIGGEVIVDLLSSITGGKDSYTSVIPEPFTFLPKNTLAIQIADGSISSKVLDDFGRSPRDSGLIKEDNRAITAAQRLYLMNSSTLFNRIQRAIPPHFNRYNKRYGNAQKIEDLYLKVLSRKPTHKEKIRIAKFVKENIRKNPWQSVLWTLLNTQEFLYHH